MQLDRFSNAAPLALIVLVVGAMYGARLSHQPIVGEESRWATGAREMLATGDWVVPRQQGRVFPERPPMNMWAMAAVGRLRGAVDPIAIRLPSITAVLLTSLVIYWYCRTLISPLAAVCGALCYASMGQVLQIGRLGESEAMFALCVGASLLVWHLGYLRAWSPLGNWTIGFALAALGALVKGPQAPVYFVAITGVFLIVRRDVRYLLRWQYLAGACAFVAIIAAWQIPFYLATDWASVKATWSGLAADRFQMSGGVKHFFTYPLETFACLLPWSPLLVALAHRETRRLLATDASVITFLVTALVVAYPTVWIAAGARGRYFMPLYPLVAVVVGVLIERCVHAAAGTYPSRAWRQFLVLWCVVTGAAGLAIGTTSVLPVHLVSSLHQPRWFAALFAIVALGVVVLLWIAYRTQNPVAARRAVVSLAAIAGLAFDGIMINVNTARWSDGNEAVARLKQHLPPGTQLVSFAPIEHRFAYYYDAPIEEVDWPRALPDLPPDVDYFCFMRQPGDTAERRAAGRGRTWYTTPGTLPFLWQEIDSICIERKIKPGERTVVLGKVVRPIQAARSDVTLPQSQTAGRAASDKRG